MDTNTGVYMSRFLTRLIVLGYPDYSAYLKGEHWLSLRARYLATPGLPKLCAVCLADDVQLHHLTYERLGCEELTDLMPLCRKCHTAVHDLLKERRWSLSRSGEAVISLSGAWVYADVNSTVPANVPRLISVPCAGCGVGLIKMGYCSDCCRRLFGYTGPGAMKVKKNRKGEPICRVCARIMKVEECFCSNKCRKKYNNKRK